MNQEIGYWLCNSVVLTLVMQSELDETDCLYCTLDRSWKVPLCHINVVNPYCIDIKHKSRYKSHPCSAVVGVLLLLLLLPEDDGEVIHMHMSYSEYLAKQESQLLIYWPLSPLQNASPPIFIWGSGSQLIIDIYRFFSHLYKTTEFPSLCFVVYLLVVAIDFYYCYP